MSQKKKDQKKNKYAMTNILRWVARIWSLLALLDAFVLIFSMGSDQVLKDWPLLALWGVAIIGLLIAWQHEAFGATVAIVLTVLHDLLYLAVKGTWLQGFMIMWAFIIPPAVLFLLVWWIEKQRKAKTKKKAHKKSNA